MELLSRGNRCRYRTVTAILATCWLIFQLAGCASDSHTAKGASRGAATGAIAGAAGGLVSALVFGGDPVDRAARGAVYGGTTGAVAGAIAGSEADRREKQQKETGKEQKDAQIEKLRQEIGNDAFDGLAALAECRHDTALSMADKAQTSDNPNYALAGLWLEVLSYADQRNEQQARNLFPKVVEKDWNIKSESQAEEAMRKTLNGLMDIRQEYNLPRVCP